MRRFVVRKANLPFLVLFFSSPSPFLFPFFSLLFPFLFFPLYAFLSPSLSFSSFPFQYSLLFSSSSFVTFPFPILFLFPFLFPFPFLLPLPLLLLFPVSIFPFPFPFLFSLFFFSLFPSPFHLVFLSFPPLFSFSSFLFPALLFPSPLLFLFFLLLFLFLTPPRPPSIPLLSPFLLFSPFPSLLTFHFSSLLPARPARSQSRRAPDAHRPGMTAAPRPSSSSLRPGGSSPAGGTRRGRGSRCGTRGAALGARRPCALSPPATLFAPHRVREGCGAAPCSWEG